MARASERASELVAEAAGAVGRIDPAGAAEIARLAKALIGALEAGGKVLVCGNGGSAADAQHIAGELAGRFRRDRRPLACLALTTDSSVLTAIGNDYGFEQVFSRQVQALGRKGDVLWALSTSGRSPNVVAAAKAAKTAGMKVLAMTGSVGGELAALAEACFRAPADRTDLVQLLHGLAYHVICELIDERFADNP